MAVGSLIWRIREYGISATLKYIWTEKINKTVFNYPTSKVILTLAEVDNKLFKLNEKKFLYFQNSFDEAFNVMSEEFIELELRGGIKRNITGNSASKTRLKVLAYLVSNLKFDIIIESGTQHGISALFLEKFSITKNCKIYSFDVKNNVRLKRNSKVNYIVLGSPFRDLFKIFTKGLINGNDRSLYFHDSDHSYENMSFEFNWAWHELKVDCLVSDDVSENTAFSIFANSNNLNPYYCKFDSGSVVGFVVR